MPSTTGWSAYRNVRYSSSLFFVMMHMLLSLFSDINFLCPVIRHKNFYSSSSSKMTGTPMTCSSSRVKSISLRWLYFHSAWPSSLNRLNAWILFGLSISTMTSWSGKCWSNYLGLTYYLRRCILAAQYGKSWNLSLTDTACFHTVMVMLSLLAFFTCGT